MTEQELTKLKTEWKAEFEREILNQKIREKMNRDNVRKIMSEYKTVFKNFDWSEDKLITRHFPGDPILDGTSYISHSDHPQAYKVYTAIIDLLKARFKVNRTADIPISEENEARTLIETILRAVAV